MTKKGAAPTAERQAKVVAANFFSQKDFLREPSNRASKLLARGKGACCESPYDRLVY